MSIKILDKRHARTRKLGAMQRGLWCLHEGSLLLCIQSDKDGVGFFRFPEGSRSFNSLTSQNCEVLVEVVSVEISIVDTQQEETP